MKQTGHIAFVLRFVSDGAEGRLALQLCGGGEQQQ